MTMPGDVTRETKEAEKAEILARVEDYTTRIEALIAERTAFMDASMPLFAEFQIGDAIYANSGRKLGVVTKHYRFWSGRDPRFDTSMSVECEYLVNGSTNCYGNTSSDLGNRPFRKEPGYLAFVPFTIPDLEALP